MFLFPEGSAKINVGGMEPAGLEPMQPKRKLGQESVHSQSVGRILSFVFINTLGHVYFGLSPSRTNFSKSVID